MCTHTHTLLGPYFAYVSEYDRKNEEQFVLTLLSSVFTFLGVRNENTFPTKRNPSVRSHIRILGTTLFWNSMLLHSFGDADSLTANRSSKILHFN